MTQATSDTSDQQVRRGQEQRSARTRRLIYEACVRCLDELGYAETSVLKVHSQAGVSRGALTHQYPTKEDMMVAVAEQLLDDVRHTPSPSVGPRPSGEEGYVEWLLLFAWGRFVDTPQGRALTEILNAMRTDKALGARLAEPVEAWRAAIEAWFLRRLVAPGGDAELREAVQVFNVFGRGLLLGPNGADAEASKDMAKDQVRAMARLLAPRLRRRGELQGGGAARFRPAAE